jgi:hypothetical protein
VQGVDGRKDLRVIRAPTPPRRGAHEDARETLWQLRQDASPAIRADLIALSDAVEVELFRGGAFRRRLRFLTDVGARGYIARLRGRLERRAFHERRSSLRTSVWAERQP